MTSTATRRRRGKHGLLAGPARVSILELLPDGSLRTAGQHGYRNDALSTAWFLRSQGRRVWLEADGVSARRPGVRVRPRVRGERW